MNKVTRAEIIDARYALERLHIKLLEQTGWTRTCNVPGSYWMWTKTFPKPKFMESWNPVMAPLDMAVEIELAWQSLTQPDQGGL
jgi:hypothetical protein